MGSGGRRSWGRTGVHRRCADPASCGVAGATVCVERRLNPVREMRVGAVRRRDSARGGSTLGAFQQVESRSASRVQCSAVQAARLPGRRPRRAPERVRGAHRLERSISRTTQAGDGGARQARRSESHVLGVVELWLIDPAGDFRWPPPVNLRGGWLCQRAAVRVAANAPRSCCTAPRQPA